MVFHLLAGLLAALMVARHGRRALLFLAPGLVRVAGDAAAGPGSAGRLRAGEALRALGFVRLGVKVERAPLGRGAHEACAFVAPDGTCADLFQEPGAAPALQLLTLFPDGAAAATATYPRRALATSRLRIGGLPGASPEAALAAHRLAVEGLRAAHGEPLRPATLEERLELARRWYRGPGAAEVRRTALPSFLSAAVALLLLGSSALSLARTLA